MIVGPYSKAVPPYKPGFSCLGEDALAFVTGVFSKGCRRGLILEGLFQDVDPNTGERYTPVI